MITLEDLRDFVEMTGNLPANAPIVAVSQVENQYAQVFSLESIQFSENEEGTTVTFVAE